MSDEYMEYEERDQEDEIFYGHEPTPYGESFFDEEIDIDYSFV